MADLGQAVIPAATDGRFAAVVATLDRRFWVTTLLASVAALAVLGIPSAVIPNPWLVRMLPTEPVNVAVWLASAPLIGLLAATYLAAPPRGTADPHGRGEGRASIAGLGAYLAIGCPICNKVIVAVLGVSGAMDVFAPLQPAIGAISLILLAGTLAWRLRRRAAGCEACAAPARSGADGVGLSQA